MPHVELTTSVRPMKICKPYAVRLIGGICVSSRGVVKSDYRPMPNVELTTACQPYRCSARLPRDAGRSGGSGGPISGDSTSTSTGTVRLPPYEYEYCTVPYRLHIRVAPFSRYCTVPVLYLYALNH